MRKAFVFSIDSFFCVLLTFTLLSLAAFIHFNPTNYSFYSLDSAARDFLVLKYSKGVIPMENNTFDFYNVHVQESKVTSTMVSHSVIFVSPEKICGGDNSFAGTEACLLTFDLAGVDLKKDAWGYYR